MRERAQGCGLYATAEPNRSVGREGIRRVRGTHTSSRRWVSVRTASSRAHLKRHRLVPPCPSSPAMHDPAMSHPHPLQPRTQPSALNCPVNPTLSLELPYQPNPQP
jgi:hypothetical protein